MPKSSSFFTCGFAILLGFAAEPARAQPTDPAIAISDTGGLPLPTLPDSTAIDVDEAVGSTKTPAYIGGPINRGAPCYGEDNMYVLTELLGRTPSEVERLAEEGVI